MSDPYATAKAALLSGDLDGELEPPLVVPEMIWQHVKTAIVVCDSPCGFRDPATLRGRRILIEDRPARILGVDVRNHPPPWRKGERVAILVEYGPT